MLALGLVCLPCLIFSFQQLFAITIVPVLDIGKRRKWEISKWLETHG